MTDYQDLYYLIGVHVRLCARPSLPDDEREVALSVQLPGYDVIAGVHNGFRCNKSTSFIARDNTLLVFEPPLQKSVCHYNLKICQAGLNFHLLRTRTSLRTQGGGDGIPVSHATHQGLNQCRTQEVAVADHIPEDTAVLSPCRAHRHRVLGAVLATISPTYNY
ncbi:hypothetical protein SFRURICE_012003 [Spodoptera frugiperda]|nr:hypothetical protein SFRURICE_012003 [Spodoptera frugiperda]